MRSKLVPLFVFAAAMSVALLCWRLPAQEKSTDRKVDLKKMKATVEQLGKPVALELQGAPIADVLKFIEDRSGVKFVTDDATLPAQTVNISATGDELAEALQHVVDQCKWTYSVRPNGDVLLQPAAQPKKAK